MDSPQARYRKVTADLREGILHGDYLPGDLLPSQPELARRYALSQTSINRAIALLVAEGLVRVEHGYGATVTEVQRVDAGGMPESWRTLLARGNRLHVYNGGKLVATVLPAQGKD